MQRLLAISVATLVSDYVFVIPVPVGGCSVAQTCACGNLANKPLKQQSDVVFTDVVAAVGVPLLRRSHITLDYAFLRIINV